MNPLLDTNLIIDYLRGQNKAADYFNQLQTCLISAVTVAEIYQGAKNKTDLRKLEKTLKAFVVIPLSEDISNLSLTLIKKYTLFHGILILDALIAATALSQNLSLTTLDLKHFRMIERLELIKPY